jgi:hypothetical protein
MVASRTVIRRDTLARLVVALFAALGLARAPRASAAEPASEYEVKAAFLYNFARFVEWPAEALADATASMVLCIFGESSLGEPLESTVAGKHVKHHALVVRNVEDADQARQCHVLFLDPTDPVRLRGILGALEGAPVLTVGEGEAFAQRGGMIAFQMEGNKVRFAINADAAERSRLQISSQLLKLAANIIGGPPLPR